MDFSKWINNEFIPNNKNYKWIKEVSSKSVKQANVSMYGWLDRNLRLWIIQELVSSV
ncbi:hypothetical protein EDD59_1531 [Muricomes intestini]|uniref:Uncharacterized protein n=3 Tax=Muricomes intestini TaxID=1796634 RepID=A0A4R3JXT9_9FIRM|nr:hypothetical protein EDD59_1531 [Muricomes intestini]